MRSPPGWTLLTRMPLGPSSAADERPKPLAAHFEVLSEEEEMPSSAWLMRPCDGQRVLQGYSNGAGKRPVVLEMTMIDAVPGTLGSGRITFAACLMVRNTVHHSVSSAKIWPICKTRGRTNRQCC